MARDRHTVITVAPAGTAVIERRTRLRFLTALALLALAVAAFAVAFRVSLTWWYARVFGASNVVDAITALPWWLRLLVPSAGGFAAGTLSRLRGARGQGVSNVMEAVVLGKIRLAMRPTISRVVASWSAIAAGLSIGREGPLIEFGGTMGASLGQWLRVSRHGTRVLVAAGTAAGFSAAYNTPLAAVLFVLETIVGVATPIAMLATIVATVIATTVTRAIVGVGPIYGQRAFALRSSWDLASFAALGVLAVGAALMFRRVLASMEDWVERHPVPQPLRATVGGGLVGLIAIVMPAVAGNGYEPLNAILDQRMMAPFIAALLLAKVVGTSSSISSGVPGGLFTPMLLVGAGVGTLWATLVGVLSPGVPVSPGSYALVGMAATTAASIHAPLTAAVLIFELSGDYPIVLPLLLATAVATGLSRWLGQESVYEAELRRKGVSWELTLEGRAIRDGDRGTLT